MAVNIGMTDGVGMSVWVGMGAGVIVPKVHLQKPEPAGMPSGSSQKERSAVSMHQPMLEPVGQLPDQVHALLMHAAPIAAHLFAQVSLPVMQVMDVGT